MAGDTTDPTTPLTPGDPDTIDPGCPGKETSLAVTCVLLQTSCPVGMTDDIRDSNLPDWTAFRGRSETQVHNSIFSERFSTPDFSPALRIDNALLLVLIECGRRLWTEQKTGSVGGNTVWETPWPAVNCSRSLRRGAPSLASRGIPSWR